MGKKRCTAVVLAAGSGSRMKSRVAKQFMLLEGKPLIWYALRAMEVSEIIDDCILVTGAEDIPYMKKEIVEKYGFSKVDTVAAGGEERFLSVANALRIIGEKGMKIPNEDGYVFIHDGARPFLTEKILQDMYEAVESYHACAAAVPCKDTMKMADKEGFVTATPNRNLLWSIQTPQVFDTGLILKAYAQYLEQWECWQENAIAVTDDAGIVELVTDTKVKLVRASYMNVKITTPEDLILAEGFLHSPEMQRETRIFTGISGQKKG